MVTELSRAGPAWLRKPQEMNARFLYGVVCTACSHATVPSSRSVRPGRRVAPNVRCSRPRRTSPSTSRVRRPVSAKASARLDATNDLPSLLPGLALPDAGLRTLLVDGDVQGAQAGVGEGEPGQERRQIV